MKVTAAIRGRDNIQTLEIQGKISNALTTVAKDNVVVFLYEDSSSIREHETNSVLSDLLYQR